MRDLDERFSALHRVRSPDLWLDIETREPRRSPAARPGRRFAMAAVALLLAAAGVAVAAVAFFGTESQRRRPAGPVASPAAPVEPVIDATVPIRWPASVVYGEGSVWVAASANDGTDTGTVYRIDPNTADILAEIPVPTFPGWETGGGGMEAAGGSLWIAGSAERGAALIRIDAVSNRVEDTVLLGGDFAGDVAIDTTGIWATVFHGGGVDLVRVDPATLAVEQRSHLDTEWAREVLAVEGAVWVRIHAGGDELVGDQRRLILRIDPVSGGVTTSVELPGGVTSVAEGDGAIWATTWNQRDGNRLARIDPTTGHITLVPSGTLDYLVEVGESGLWGRGLDPSTGRLGIVRFDPATGQIDASVELGEDRNPIALAVAPDSVWVATHKEGVIRIELRPA